MDETGLFSNFWFWVWMIFMTGLHVALAERSSATNGNGGFWDFFLESARLFGLWY